MSKPFLQNVKQAYSQFKTVFEKKRKQKVKKTDEN